MKAIHDFLPDLSIRLKSRVWFTVISLSLIISLLACDDEEALPELNALPDIVVCAPQVVIWSQSQSWNQT